MVHPRPGCRLYSVISARDVSDKIRNVRRIVYRLPCQRVHTRPYLRIRTCVRSLQFRMSDVRSYLRTYVDWKWRPGCNRTWTKETFRFEKYGPAMRNFHVRPITLSLNFKSTAAFSFFGTFRRSVLSSSWSRNFVITPRGTRIGTVSTVSYRDKHFTKRSRCNNSNM